MGGASSGDLGTPQMSVSLRLPVAVARHSEAPLPSSGVAPAMLRGVQRGLFGAAGPDTHRGGRGVCEGGGPGVISVKWLRMEVTSSSQVVPVEFSSFPMSDHSHSFPASPALASLSRRRDGALKPKISFWPSAAGSPGFEALTSASPTSSSG